jgi:YegS/Rv2252/BmrU family lipid kinase
MSSTRRVLAIVNPATGILPAWRIERMLLKAAADLAIELDVRYTEYEDHAIELAQAAIGVYDTVVAVGGDGTVSEVAAGLVGVDINLAIVPAGSTNMIAKDLGIPLRLSQAIRVALSSSTTVDLDIAFAMGAAFLHMAGAGYDAEIMRSTPRRWKRKVGWLAYIGPALGALRSAPFQLDLEVDGEQSSWRARMVLCGLGGSIIHPRFVVGRGIDRTDGVADILVFNPRTFGQVLTTFSWLALGRPERSRWHHHFRGQRIVMTADRPVPFEADGSYRGELPVEINVIPQGVTVVVPSLPTPGELRAHTHPRYSVAEAEYLHAGSRFPV